MKVGTRAVTSTVCPGTPHSAPTNSPPCAMAEPASKRVQARLPTTHIADLNRIDAPLTQNDRCEYSSEALYERTSTRVTRRTRTSMESKACNRNDAIIATH